MLFELETPLGFKVRCTSAYWDYIVDRKHPVLSGREKEIQRVPQGREVPLFYREDSDRWICAVVRRQDGSGFLITAYRTDAVKAGDIVWKKSA
ncbi:MAG: hypothetical protein WA854_07845 [Candidatus Binataceae bacterium]